MVGPPPQPEEINRLDNNWVQNTHNNIITIKNASEQELLELYTNAEFLIFPSFIEGFGWPPLEAASIGCPVITTKTGAIFDILGKDACYVEPLDQQTINNVVLKILRKKECFTSENFSTKQ